MTRNIKLEFITPLFSHGATDVAEIRPPSIRGQLHWWFRLLGGNVEQERSVFGGIKQSKGVFDGKDKTLASKLVVRVSNVQGTQGDVPTLPHKHGGMSAPRRAFLPGATCDLTLMDRLGGLGENEYLLQNSVNAWLLMGSLGFRAARGGGNFVWSDGDFPQPDNPLAYQDACRDLLDECGAKARVAVLDKDYEKAEQARAVITDSLGGPSGRDDETDLRDWHEPLGYVGRRFYDKNLPSRKSSPLKYRIVRFASGFRILAFWDGREAVTGNSEKELFAVVDLLAKKKPEIGEQLRKAF